MTCSILSRLLSFDLSVQLFWELDFDTDFTRFQGIMRRLEWHSWARYFRYNYPQCYNVKALLP